MHRRRVLRAVGTAATATTISLAGCIGGDDEGEYDVGMTANAFAPEEITVSAGESVVWRNTSARTHTVTAYEDAIPEAADYWATGGYDDETTARDAWWEERGGALENSDEFSRTFEEPGRYDYVCIPHEEGGMIGSVVVEE